MLLSRVFIANRGEIAVRIIRAAQALGIETVLAVSAADQDSLPAHLADKTVLIGPAPSVSSYLDPNIILHAALATGCDALHPGYGFLSERASLASLCVENNITFVGPRAETIEALGDKLRARSLAKSAGVPLIPGTDKVDTPELAKQAAKGLGYPVVLKASAGGGGRGMFVATSSADIDSSFQKCSMEAQEAFGDGTLYLERFVESARHVEVQVMGDGKGKVIHFGERDCSIQRRYQKVIEEAPCPVLPSELRRRLHQSAIQLTSSLNYLNAGTVEFLYDMKRQEFYFIEVNARIQVEHPVTEQVTGFDLVQQQLRIAGGEPLDLKQEQINISRHSIECRINAEDPARDFFPNPGLIKRWCPPIGAGVRVETHCRDNYQIPPYYDSMVAKLVITANDRITAVARANKALRKFQVQGLTTNIPLLRYIVAHPEFENNQLNTRWLEKTLLPAFKNDEETTTDGTY